MLPATRRGIRVINIDFIDACLFIPAYKAGLSRQDFGKPYYRNLFFGKLMKQKNQERFPMIDVSPVKIFIINNFLFGDGSKLTTETLSFLDSGIVDSTGILELIAFLEKEYEITISDDEMLPENLDSLAHIQAFISKKKHGDQTPEIFSLKKDGLT